MISDGPFIKVYQVYEVEARGLNPLKSAALGVAQSP
jgi:hypothetical protein